MFLFEIDDIFKECLEVNIKIKLSRLLDIKLHQLYKILLTILQEGDQEMIYSISKLTR